MQLVEKRQAGERVVINLHTLRSWLGDTKASMDKKYRDNIMLEAAETIAAIFRRHGLFMPSKQYQKVGIPKFRIVSTFDFDEASTPWSILEPYAKHPTEFMGQNF
jgi:hypothetical protein